MLAALIPLFDAGMDVHSYCVFAQRENFLLDSLHSGVSKFDNASQIEGFDILESMGIETLAEDREIFVPLNHVALFSDLQAQCSAPPEKVVLLVDAGVKPDDMYAHRLRELREQGFRFAMQKLPFRRMGDYRDILLQCEYILLNPHRVNMQKAKALFERIYPNLKLCAVHVDSPQDFEAMRQLGEFHFYQGSFFRVPADNSDAELSPLKTTYMELLRVVNEEDYDLITAADVISQDTALVLSLLAIVNRMTLNYGITSVRHAAAMLGQTELKRWINTAITKELCSDKPSEITRLSLLRARFAENLASVFGMGGMSDEFFLMGLFSVLDIMLERPIEAALEGVRVSKNIYNALVSRTGEFAPVYHFLLEYENASWQEISRLMIVHRLDMDAVYQAYLDSLQWYRDLISVA